MNEWENKSMIMRGGPEDSNTQLLITWTGEQPGCSSLENPAQVSQTCRKETLFHVVGGKYLVFNPS